MRRKESGRSDLWSRRTSHLKVLLPACQCEMFCHLTRVPQEGLRKLKLAATSGDRLDGGPMAIRPRLLHLFDDQGGVLAAEAEGVGEGAGKGLLSGVVGDVIEVAIRIRGLVVDGGGDEIMVHAQDGGNQL